MHFLLCPLGTAGDVHPFLGIGQGLRRRGHRVSIITHSHFGPTAARHGFEFIDLCDEPDYSITHDHPDVWHPTKGGRRGAEFFLRSTMRPLYAAIAERYVPGETVVMSTNSGFGGRIAHDKLGVPYITAHFAPCYIPSVRRPPKYPWWRPPDWAPHWVHDVYFRLGDRFVVDPLLAPPINAFRAELGLPPVRRVLNTWNQSPQLVLAMFPDWLCRPRPEDWPPQLVTTHFPLFDDRENDRLPPEVEKFLQAGDAPIVFTPGTGVRHAHHFFAAAVDACRLLGRRGMLLTRFPEHVPPDLPATVMHVGYLPFGLLLPRAAALVSHGGIGTLAQALRAGIPQLVMPFSHDQPDNARRMVDLGVGRILVENRFTGRAAARELQRLLANPAAQARCRELSAHFPPDTVAPTLDVLEDFARKWAR